LFRMLEMKYQLQPWYGDRFQPEFSRH
jgi:hypothetical protein